jgi:hypothetical protein
VRRMASRFVRLIPLPGLRCAAPQPELLPIPRLCISTLTPNHSRFGGSSLHQRDPRSALFENYNGGASNTGERRNGSSSPGGYGYNPGGGYGYAGNEGLGGSEKAYRPATPNSRYVCVLGKGGEWGLRADFGIGDSIVMRFLMSWRVRMMGRSRGLWEK